MHTVTVRCRPAARDRLVALARESRRSVAGVLEVLSTATVSEMLDPGRQLRSKGRELAVQLRIERAERPPVPDGLRADDARRELLKLNGGG